jgi:SSS family solute:Na+ symporter
MGNPLPLALALGVYVAALFGIGWWARSRIHDASDFLVAGRRLSFPLATATLFATWFGAGTLLAVADEVRAEGLRATALDPIGAGACLLLAGLFLAAPLWRLQLLTLPDYFRGRFGPRAELAGALLMVPGYFGWIAAQFVALASLLELCFGLDLALGIALVALVGTGYTLLGGMWSVALTDALQTALLLVGLVVTTVVTLAALGDGAPAAGLARLAAETPPEMLRPIPLEGLAPLAGWLGLLAAGALGNLPGQDLLQRIFAARSARVARRACLVAGVAYLTFGALPPLLGLAARLLAPDQQRAVLPMVAGLVAHPAVVLVFVLAVVSAVLSTIDSALLAPASVLAQNVVARVAPRAAGRLSPLAWNQWAVVAVALASLAVAYRGEDAFALLESAYEVGLVSLLVPLVAGLYWRRGDEQSALAAMAAGTLPWLVHWLADWEWFAEPWLAPRGVALPAGLSCAALAVAAYVACALRPSRMRP